jgi:mannose-6-phosphate isomerase-like protein (cupin superfamily)
MNEQLDVRVLASNEGLILQSVGQVRNRFMIDSTETDGRFGLLQHIFEPKALAAPMHRHHDEDEYTYVLSGRIGAVLGGQEVFGGPGDLIFKPRNQWHTFWNAGDEPAVVMEIISPGGLEQFFKTFGELSQPVDPMELKEKAAAMAHVDTDLDATFPIIQRHGLVF